MSILTDWLPGFHELAWYFAGFATWAAPSFCWLAWIAWNAPEMREENEIPHPWDLPGEEFDSTAASVVLPMELSTLRLVRNEMAEAQQ